MLVAQAAAEEEEAEVGGRESKWVQVELSVLGVLEEG